jgi:hypothetical protein
MKFVDPAISRGISISWWTHDIAAGLATAAPLAEQIQ